MGIGSVWNMTDMPMDFQYMIFGSVLNVEKKLEGKMSPIRTHGVIAVVQRWTEIPDE